MMLGLIIVVLLYVTALLVLMNALRRVKSTKTQPSEEWVTVLIPVRNEEFCIQRTVQSILTNKYHNIEVLVIDDHSTDRTAEIVSSIDDDRVCLLKLEGSKTGKKAAITMGVDAAARGDIVICTDGDTVVGERWVENHVTNLLEEKVLVFGPVKYFDRGGFWTKLLNTELTALVGVGAATSVLGKASMINGCNYSFRKKAFKKVAGFEGNEHVASGDDEFLLRKITKFYPDGVAFLGEEGGRVETEPPASVRQFYYQRKRWASKWKHHRDLLSWVMPLFVFAIYALFVGLAFYLFFDHKTEVIGCIAVKLLADWMFLKKSSTLTGVRLSVLTVFCLQIIYPFYVVFFGIASNFGKFRWRSRSYPI
ncbi:glycosyltransferase [Reichenbachiella agariperforans]|uniref:glycosyltransferase n=1 Tax=Reichenbachiella agariperforans TaxID=156994 RepID=UPI001C09780A|nr:glycosyltransferase [Reichenbachiella agariperforans]MBU2913883.1 glycosyltransferase [Reichenbachiella agariperforans]